MVATLVRALIWVMAVIALAGAGAAGYAIGHRQTPLETIQSGTVYVTANEGTASADGFNYSVPTNLSWTDATGTIHEGGQRPPCLPLDHASHVVFAAVKYSIAGATQGTVVWVRC